MANDDLKPKSEHKSRKSEEIIKNKLKSHKRRHSSTSSGSVSPAHKKKHSKKPRHKKRSRTTTSNSSSTDSDKERERKKRKKAKKKAKKLIKELKKIQKRKEKEAKSKIDTKEKTDKSCNDVPLELMDRTKAMVPMTKEEWEKKQSVVRKVYDEETGRHRLIKGDGEVIEEIVSRDRHKAINKQATEGDGNFFQSKLNINFRK